jgi:predicted SnoaL-like aldol condensation-catalyzing enzyme
MNHKALTALVSSIFFLCTAAKAQHIDVEKWAAGNANKRVVLEYIDQVNQGDMRGASAKYGTPDYLNHRNVRPLAPGNAGPAGAPPAGPPPPLPAGAPPAGGANASGPPPAPLALNAVIGQVVAEGDYVVVHYMITNNRDNGRPITSSGGRPGGPKIGTNVMEIFRLQNGKIAEKWDDLEALDSLSVFQ